MLIRSCSILTVILAITVVGCSSNIPTIPDENHDLNPAVTSGTSSNRTLWGVWEVSIDPLTLEAEISPLRFATFHANVRQFLEASPCQNCLSIVPPIVPTAYGFDVDLSLRHPFPGLSRYIGFDVRGILMLEGSYYFPGLSSTTTRAATGEWALLNPDGYTKVFNSEDYNLPGMLGYSRGKMIPPMWGDPSNNLNAFKAYYSDGQSEDEGGRRAFFDGDAVTRTYRLQLVEGEPMKFWYAVDASWEPPDVDPPTSLDDFPISANCPEAYRFEFSVVSGEIYPGGGMIRLGMSVWDHQGYQPGYGIICDAPECNLIPFSIGYPPFEIDGDRAYWEFNVVNSLWGQVSPELGTELLVMAINPDDDPFNGDIDGWGRFTIPVSEGPIPDPEVFSINPDQGVQYQGLDNAEISGANFLAGCTVHLEKSGEPDVIGMDVVVLDSENITVDFSFSGAALGFWDVVVVNPGGGTGSLPGGFEIVEPSGCNHNLHNNFLGTGDFSGGTHMPAFDAVFVHDTGTESDGEFLGYISGFGGTVVVTYIIDTLIPVDGHPLGTGWGNPQPGFWPVPRSIDVSEELGQFFIVWDTNYSIVEVWEAADGKLAGETDASSSGTVFCLDTDGYGGFWNGYFPQAGFAPGIKHFVPDGPQPGTLIEVTEDSFLLPEAWGDPTELICIPDQVLLVLTGFNHGKIFAFDISASPPTPVGELTGIFSGDLDFGTFPDKSCDMAIDWSDTDYAHCRIIVFGNLQSGGVELVKIDTDLTVWAGPVSIPSNHYQSIDINPDTGDVALWPPRDGSPGEYALIEQPPGW